MHIYFIYERWNFENNKDTIMSLVCVCVCVQVNEQDQEHSNIWCCSFVCFNIMKQIKSKKKCMQFLKLNETKSNLFNWELRLRMKN